MVILESVAIGAAGYGAFRGGEASVNKGKQAHKEMIRERKRMNQRSELASKSKDRKERISKLANLRSSNTVDTIQSTEPKSSVEDRHKRVMEKLNTARPKSNSKFNVFKLNKK